MTEAWLTEEYRNSIADASVQGSYGYGVPLTKMLPVDRNAVIVDLTLAPVVKKGFGAQGEPIIMYRRNSKFLFLPMSYGFRRYGLPGSSTIVCKDKIAETLEFNPGITLTPKQTHVCNLFMEHVTKSYIDIGELDEKNNETKITGRLQLYDGAVIGLPCGAGKTVVVIKLISLLRVPTIVVLTKEALITQWKERLEEYLPGARIGIVQGNKVDAKDKDVVLCSLQTVFKPHKFPTELRKRYGMVVFDEAHRMVSQKYSAVVFQLTAPIRLAVTASLDSELHRVLDLAVGPTLFNEKRTGEGDNLIVRAVNFHSTDADFLNIEMNSSGVMNYSGMLTKLTKFEPRIDFLCNLILGIIKEFPESAEVQQALAAVPLAPYVPKKKKENKSSSLADIFANAPLPKKSRKRKKDQAEKSAPYVKPKYPGIHQVIVFSVETELLEILFERLSKQNVSVGMFIGQMDAKDLDASAARQVILATFSMASEGLDIHTLSGLVFAMPRSTIEQPIGRILRSKFRQKIVYDVIDDHALFRSQFRKRCIFYKSCKYPIVNANDSTNSKKRKRENDDSDSDSCDYSSQPCLL